jgi:hypothetical protein
MIADRGYDRCEARFREALAEQKIERRIKAARFPAVKSLGSGLITRI